MARKKMNTNVNGPKPEPQFPEDNNLVVGAVPTDPEVIRFDEQFKTTMQLLKQVLSQLTDVLTEVDRHTMNVDRLSDNPELSALYCDMIQERVKERITWLCLDTIEDEETVDMYGREPYMRVRYLEKHCVNMQM